MPAAELDRRFSEWMKSRFTDAAKGVGIIQDSTAAPGEIDQLLERAATLKQQGQPDGAIPLLERADRLFPDMADPDSPPWALAQLYDQKGQSAKAIEYLKRAV